MMENHDKFTQQFKSAAQTDEQKDFAALDKVWQRVEDRLDTKALTRQNNSWKKFAVAASVLLCVSLSYQLFTSSNEEKSNITNRAIVVSDSIKTEQPRIVQQDGIALADTTILKTEAPKLLEQRLQQPAAAVIVSAEMVAPASSQTEEVATPAPVMEREEKMREMQPMSAKKETNRNNFNAQSQSQASQFFDSEPISGNRNLAKAKSSPLYVTANGKAVTAADDSSYDKKLARELAKMKENTTDSLLVLKEPLYIINGREYSEEELFGENPTSPYAPLHLQPIVSISILLDEEAVEKYGKKGKKGVVIISTKNGKPVKTTQQK